MISVVIVHHGENEILKRTEKMLKSQSPPVPFEVVVEKSDKPLANGFDSVAWNRAIRKSKGEILILNKPETLSWTPSITQHAAWHDKKKNLAVFSTVFLQNGAREIGTPGSLGDLLTGPERHAPLFYCGSIRREWVEKVRGFDEGFMGMIGHCDADFAGRLQRAGVEFKWDPKIVCVHQYVNPIELKGPPGKTRLEENHKKKLIAVNPETWGGEK